MDVAHITVCADDLHITVTSWLGSALLYKHKLSIPIHSAAHSQWETVKITDSLPSRESKFERPNSEHQVSNWRAELVSLPWRVLARFWCRFCPQFGFRNLETVSTKTNAPCHFPRRWAIFAFTYPNVNLKKALCDFCFTFSLPWFCLMWCFVSVAILLIQQASLILQPLKTH